MKNDLDKLQLNLEYGQVIKFNNNYNILNPSDKNFKKYDKFIKNSEIALPVFLLKFHGIEINTSQNFLKFKLKKNPKKIQSFFISEKNIKSFIDINAPQSLDINEKKIINIFIKFFYFCLFELCLAMSIFNVWDYKKSNSIRFYSYTVY